MLWLYLYPCAFSKYMILLHKHVIIYYSSLVYMSPFSTRAAVLVLVSKVLIRGCGLKKEKKKGMAKLALITVYEEIIFDFKTDPI